MKGTGQTRKIIRILGGLLILLAGALVYAYNRDMRAARARIATGSALVQTDCGPIEYATAGEGVPLLVVHGAGGGFDQGLDIARPYVDQGFRAIAPSRFGYLRTPLPADASAQAQSEAHACLLDALGIARAHVVGVSAGATSALQFAIRHPDRTRALVLLVPAAYAPRPEPAPAVTPAPGTELLFETALRSDFLFWFGINFARKTITRSILATPPEIVENASDQERARVRSIMGSILPVSARRNGLINDGKVITAIERYNLEAVRAPTLVVSVRDDLFGTYPIARYTVAQIPGARLLGFERGGHVWVGHHEEIQNDVVKFLRTVR